MENLYIEKTAQCPEINFQSNGELSIKGVSNSNNSLLLFQPAINWLSKFKDENPPQINLVLELYYLNTSSSLILVDMIKVINSCKHSGTRVNISWYYEEDDEDILDLGEDFQLTTQSEFEFVLIQ